MAGLLLSLLLLAPVDRQWSEKHGVGLWVPQQWKVNARDQGNQVFVVEGPKLGPGIPHARLLNGGPAAESTLEQFADGLVGQVEKRTGWKVVARQRKLVGDFPAVRIGIRFLEEGAKGRARFTAVLLGGNFYVLELSASARNFPGGTFDRIEKSLAVRWTEHTLEGGLTLKVPAGWLTEGDDRFLGPRLGIGTVMLRVWRVDGGLSGPPEAKPGPKLEFLGQKRETLVALHEERGLKMLVVHGEGWNALAILPQDAWPDTSPVLEAILRQARLPRAEK